MRKLLAWIAGLALVAGLAVLGVGVYKAWDPFAGMRQDAAQRHLYGSWGPPPVQSPHRGSPGPDSGSQGCQVNHRPAIGRVFGIIQIPALGRHWRFTIIQGTELPQLATGPGHIPQTALPGQRGNVGIAAHDVTAGNPFLHLADLRPGDLVVITTQRCVVTYRVNKPSFRVWYTNTSILRPHGRKHTLTLITCWPVGVLYAVPHRTIVTAEEISSHRR